MKPHILHGYFSYPCYVTRLHVPRNQQEVFKWLTFNGFLPDIYYQANPGCQRKIFKDGHPIFIFLFFFFIFKTNHVQQQKKSKHSLRLAFQNSKNTAYYLPWTSFQCRQSQVSYCPWQTTAAETEQDVCLIMSKIVLHNWKLRSQEGVSYLRVLWTSIPWWAACDCHLFSC